jgi:hypothetical protein
MPLDEPHETVSARVLVEVDLGRYVTEQVRVNPDPTLLSDALDDLAP